jgi:predicted metal-dependent hydrolase
MLDGMNQTRSESGNILLGNTNVSYTVSRSKKRRRNIAFDIQPPATLRISAPVRVSFSSIQNIIHRNSDWIARRLEKINASGIVPPRQFTDSENITYLGHAYRLKVLRDENIPQGCRLRPHRMEVNIHGDWLSDEALAQEVRLEILLWLKKRAKEKIQKRTGFWARRMGVKYRELKISDPDRRWGSCNAQNVIRLNWRLIMAPLGLLDYVVVHELAHVPHKNHSQRFWRFVASAMPDWQARRKQLRRMGHGLVL